MATMTKERDTSPPTLPDGCACGAPSDSERPGFFRSRRHDSSRSTQLDLSRVSRTVAGFWLSWEHSLGREMSEKILNPYQDHIVSTGPLSPDEEVDVRLIVEEEFFMEMVPQWCHRANLDSIESSISKASTGQFMSLYRGAGIMAASVRVSPEVKAYAEQVANRTGLIACADIIGVESSFIASIVSVAVTTRPDIQDIERKSIGQCRDLLLRCCHEARRMAAHL